MWTIVVVLAACLLFALREYPGGRNGGGGGRDDFYLDTFPADFKWGLATAAYQIEGAWNVSDKGENIWDNFSHRPKSPMVDGSSGDVACDSFHLFKEDVNALKNTGAQMYRFSISWSRLLPDGTKSKVSQTGLDYYNGLIDELIANGIEPVPTLYHWDLPQPLQELGGWTNEKMADYFADYARIAFQSFGDRIKMWVTFNEILVYCLNGYGYGLHAPGLSTPEGPYQCVHNSLKAHALAYRVYEAEFRKTQGGKIGVTVHGGWNEPADPNNAEDVAASHRANRFQTGWIANPLYYGKYPDIMRELVDARSKAEGRKTSRLPKFDEKWTTIVKGSLDFLGINQYTSNYITAASGNNLPPGFDGDVHAKQSFDPDWAGSGAGWLKVVPWGMRRMLRWAALEYGNPDIFITENGFGEPGEEDGVHDARRVNYYRLYINEMLKAVKIDGVHVKGYFGWSLLDNFEWNEGYTQRFGVHFVDYANGNFDRVPKDSAKFLAKVFHDNGFPKQSKN